MALDAPGGRRDLQSARVPRPNLTPPRSRLVDDRHGVEVRHQINQFRVADLRRGVGGHDSPWFPNRVYELCAGQLATGQVWSQRAFTVVAMTFPALDVLGLQPKNLSPLGITSGRRGCLLRERLLKEREQKQNHEKGAHRHCGKNLPGANWLAEARYLTSDSIVGKVGDDQGRRLPRWQLATPFERGIVCLSG